MNILRKGLFVIDVLLLLVVVFCISHTLAFVQYWPFLLLDIALLSRFNSVILLYRKEKWSIVPIIVFVILFGVYYCNGIFDNTIFRMAEYPSIVLGTQDYDVIEKNIIGERILNIIFLWVWLIPVVVYLYQAIRKQLACNNYRWFDITCLAIFKDKVGQLLVALGILTFIAMLIGLTLDVVLSQYTLLATPVAAYYIINRYVKRKVHWIEYVLLVIALYMFNQSQFVTDRVYIAFLTTYTVIVLSLCVYILVNSKKVFASLLILVMITALPLLSLGYNIYSYTDGTRGTNYEGGGHNGRYMYTIKRTTEGDLLSTKIGLRGRYYQIIPSNYRVIVPTSILSPFAKCITERGDTITYYLETGQILEKDKFK